MAEETPTSNGVSTASDPEVKEDPDITASQAHRQTSPPLRIKKEESDDEDLTFNPPPGPVEEDSKDNDMFDDVDGPEYVDLTYEGIAEVDGVNCFVCEEFKIRQIPKPVIVTRPLYQLFDCIESKHITLDPDYQREVVWDEGRAALLINSILMGYFIPPIIFNCVQQIVKMPNGTKQSQHKRICVDGKQRLTSVWKFMTGQIGFFDSNTPQKKWYFCGPLVNGREGTHNRNILPNAVKEFFKNQAFCCYEYDELTLDTEETMFQLVQRGVALTPAEKMRAMSTEWATFAKQYEDDYPLIINLSKQNRASGFRLTLTIFSMVQEVLSGKEKKKGSRSLAPTLQASPQALGRVLEDKTPISPEIRARFKSIFDRYETLIKLSSTQLTTTRYKVQRDSPFDPAPIWLRGEDVDHVRTFSPLELVATAILITVHGDKRTDEELLNDLKEMRHYLRVIHQDLRVNAQCWMTTWDFLSRVLELQWNGKAPTGKFLTHEDAKRKQKEHVLQFKAAERAALAKAAAKEKKNSRSAKGKEKSTSQAAKKDALPEILFPNLGNRRSRPGWAKKAETYGNDDNDNADSDSDISEFIPPDDEFVDIDDDDDEQANGESGESSSGAAKGASSKRKKSQSNGEPSFSISLSSAAAYAAVKRRREMEEEEEAARKKLRAAETSKGRTASNGSMASNQSSSQLSSTGSSNGITPPKSSATQSNDEGSSRSNNGAGTKGTSHATPEFSSPLLQRSIETDEGAKSTPRTSRLEVQIPVRA